MFHVEHCLPVRLPMFHVEHLTRPVCAADVPRGTYSPCRLPDVPRGTLPSVGALCQMFHVEHVADCTPASGVPRGTLPTPQCACPACAARCSTWNIPLDNSSSTSARFWSGSGPAKGLPNHLEIASTFQYSLP